MLVKLELAADRDAASIAALRTMSAHEHTRRHGEGPWSFTAESEGGVRAQIIGSNVFVARIHGQLAATLRLSIRNPWLGDTAFFSASPRPLYLTSLVVAPRWQRIGVGRQCLEEACRHARVLNGDTIRLDTYDGPAGAADFYRKSGFREVHRGDYHGTPLIWFERIFGPESGGSREYAKDGVRAFA